VRSTFFHDKKDCSGNNFRLSCLGKKDKLAYEKILHSFFVMLIPSPSLPKKGKKSLYHGHFSG
jgi:hypothetical protein